MISRPRLLAITGPTGSGKSSWAVELAKLLDGEIINADSVQFYRGLDIGSSKPSLEQMQDVPHHLFSILDPDQSFDAGHFVELAKAKITDITDRGRLPIVVGGTGLYITSLLGGILRLGQISSAVKELVRIRETEILSEIGITNREIIDQEHKNILVRGLYKWLLEIDRLTAEELSPNDISRIRRALEVKLETGLSLAEIRREHGRKEYHFTALVFILLQDRDKLYQTIDQRVDLMLAQGWIDEVKGLLEKFPATCKSLQSIGYKQVVQYLNGEVTYQLMIEEIKRATRRFAKRQLTWWRNQPKVMGWRDITETQGFNRLTLQGADCIFSEIPIIVGKFFENSQLESLNLSPGLVMIERKDG